MHFWKSNIFLHQLDVQETNVSIPQFHKVGKPSVTIPSLLLGGEVRGYGIAPKCAKVEAQIHNAELLRAWDRFSVSELLNSVCGRAAQRSCGELNPGRTPSLSPDFFCRRLQSWLTRATLGDSTAELCQNPPYGASSGWLVILSWRLGSVHEFTCTQAARRNPGSGHEKAGGTGLCLLLWCCTFQMLGF